MKKRKVLLIGWDGADWEHIHPLLDAGMMPTLEALINRGTIGNLATLQPVLSPMLWNSVSTGKHAYKHGVLGFIEPNPDGEGARPFSSYSRKTCALWNILSHAGYRTNVINWWASHPAEAIRGCAVSNAFGGTTFDPQTNRFHVSRGAIHPPNRSGFLSRFKVFPNEITSEQICAFIPRAAEIDQDEDTRLEGFAKVLSETLTTHSVATAVMEVEPWDFMAIYYTGVDHFSHGFMQFHPPRMPHIPERDFEIFKDVITGCYRFHDMMLERLLQLAGEDTTVILCSDHGFQSGDLRPVQIPREPAGPAHWHRRFGIFVAAGPGIKQDERVYGASLVDITPTILTLFDLPVGQDMDGKPLLEIYTQSPAVKAIPSWDEVDGARFGMFEKELPMSAEETEELMQQFAALGYIDDPAESKTEQAQQAATEIKYNLARNHAWLGMNDQAITLLEELVEESPWENRFIANLANAYFRAGYYQRTVKLLEKAFDIRSTPQVQAQLDWALAKLELGDRKDSLAVMARIMQREQRSPGVLIRIGDAFLKHRMFQNAERAYAKAIELHPDSPEAHVGMSSCHLRARRNQEAADEALTALGLVYRLTRGHFNLGLALARSGEFEKAVVAFQTAVRCGPNHLNAHRMLAMLYRRHLKNETLAESHRNEVKRIQQQTENSRGSLRLRAIEPKEFPQFLPEQDRVKRLLEERPDPVNPRKRSGRTFVLVSGLPRSGTSLMMQMLEAGGLEPRTDGERNADVDNPQGYYEWEAIKKIHPHSRLLDEEGLEQKAIKVITMLLKKLPFNHEYKVIFMNRPVSEVMRSQTAMIERLETHGGELDPSDMERGLEAHRNEMIHWLQHHPRATCLVVDYPELVQNPDAVVPRIAEFVGAELLPHPERMKAVIQASLYRKRAASQSDR
jgi:predicted AlkP superfamily phosphohydrolase/phosphomutase/tetratricopeptide (TPR) repeat protein